MIYELRVYRCVPGRLPNLLKRFETTTLKLWEKHGIRPSGFFTTLIGESNQELTYLLAWESLAEREKKWTAFQTDPDWISARAKARRTADRRQHRQPASDADGASTPGSNPDIPGLIGLDRGGADRHGPRETGTSRES